MGTGAEVADRSVPDAHQAPVAGIADIDDADVAFDLPAAAVDRRPVGVADENLAVAHDLFHNRDMAYPHAARPGQRQYRPPAVVLAPRRRAPLHAPPGLSICLVSQVW